MIVSKSLKRILHAPNDTRLFVCGISSLLNGSNPTILTLGRDGRKVTGHGESCRPNLQADKYGLPDPVSNMPHIEFAISDHETPKERKFREFKQSLASWHQQFWLTHNESFKKDKKEYLKQRPSSHTMDEKDHADDLSLFYKDFLDKNHRIHFKYQREWYKKNFQCLWYGLQVKVEKLFKKFQVKNK